MLSLCLIFFFFNDTATTEIYTLSLHDALPIWIQQEIIERDLYATAVLSGNRNFDGRIHPQAKQAFLARSEEHTSELQSLAYLVCRLLLEKKKKINFSFSSSPAPGDNRSRTMLP